VKENIAANIDKALQPCTSDLSGLSPATVNFARDALFLDFDGTLAEIAPAPDLVALFPETRAVLQVLVESFSGAVAIITGRQMSEIDRHLSPLQLPIAGLYGLVHRSASGEIVDMPTDGSSLGRASAELKTLVTANPGLLLELKGQTIALHYRTRPELAGRSLAAAEAAVQGRHDLKVIEGKMVVEIAPAGADKGRAVQDFLQEQPFVGRRPIYVGDDISDEAAFAAVNALDGLSIKVGNGSTKARYRASNSKGIRDWLGTLAATSIAGRAD